MNNIMHSKSFRLIFTFSIFILLFSAPYGNAQDADEITEGIEKGAKITKEVIKALGTIFGDDKKEKEKKKSGKEEDEFESPSTSDTEPIHKGDDESQTYPGSQGGITSGGYNQALSYQPGYGTAPSGQYMVPNQPVGPGQYQSTGGGYYPNQVNQRNVQYGTGQGGYTDGGYNQQAPYQPGYGVNSGGQYPVPNQPAGVNPYQSTIGSTNPNQTFQSNTSTGTTSSNQTVYAPTKLQVNPSIQKQAEVLRNEGYVLYQNTQYQMAIDVLNRVIQLNPMDSYAYFYRGVSYMGLKLMDMAIRDLQMSIDLNPGYSHSYSNLGAAFLEVKDLDSAIRTCSTAIQLNPNHTLGYYNRGVAYMLSKQYQLAFADFSQVLRLNPNHPDAKVNIEYVQKKLAKGNSTN